MGRFARGIKINMSAKRGGFDRRLLSLQGVERNARQRIDAVELLSRIPDRIATMFFFDPQYRAVLDKLAFGNEGERQQGRAALKSMSDGDIAFVIEEAGRVLNPSGHLLLWMDKFSLASGHWRRWVRHAPQLEIVDLISWNKMRPGMGRRTRCQTEFLIILQKVPLRAKDIWTDHRLTDFWTESSDRGIHAHAKPYQLTERLIRAATQRGDLVIDPCAGGYGVLEACRASGREFIGGDLI
jgi:site-specific DNA-methyltransferase (adenine-specific)